jgi:hypothetical protein
MSTSAKASESKRLAKPLAASPLRHFPPRGIRVRGRRPTKLERRGAIAFLAALAAVLLTLLVVFALDVQ